jgi:hypothetical protein
MKKKFSETTKNNIFLWNLRRTLDNGACGLVLKYVGKMRAAKRDQYISRCGMKNLGWTTME